MSLNNAQLNIDIQETLFFVTASETLDTSNPDGVYYLLSERTVEGVNYPQGTTLLKKGDVFREVAGGGGGGGDDFLPSPELSYDDYTSALYNLHVKADGSWVAVRRDVSTLTGTRVEGIAGTKPTTSEQLMALFNN